MSILEFLEITSESILIVVGLYLIVVLSCLLYWSSKQYCIFKEKVDSVDKVDLLHYLFDVDSNDLDFKQILDDGFSLRNPYSDKTKSIDSDKNKTAD